jgi:hypothetical protein
MIREIEWSTGRNFAPAGPILGVDNAEDGWSHRRPDSQGRGVHNEALVIHKAFSDGHCFAPETDS